MILTAEQKQKINESLYTRTELLAAAIETLEEWGKEHKYRSTVLQKVDKVKEIFNSSHTELMRISKMRFSAEQELSQMLNSTKNVDKSRILKKESEVSNLQEEWFLANETFLDARRWEEFVRGLPSVLKSDTSDNVIILTEFMLLTAVWSPKILLIQDNERKVRSLLR